MRCRGRGHRSAPDRDRGGRRRGRAARASTGGSGARDRARTTTIASSGPRDPASELRTRPPHWEGAGAKDPFPPPEAPSPGRGRRATHERYVGTLLPEPEGDGPSTSQLDLAEPQLLLGLRTH